MPRNPEHILFVEDDPDQSELWIGRLRASGLEVTAAANGLDAIAAVMHAEAQPIDVVLMDVSLGGGMGGIEAAARLRVFLPALPVIFMSAHGDGDTLEEAKLARPAGYLLKPFKYADLLQAIERATSQTMPEISNDHDLLVRLDVKLDLVSVQLNEARALVAAKADRETLEPRLQKIERAQDWTTNKMYMLLGGLVVIEVLLKILKL